MKIRSDYVSNSSSSSFVVALPGDYEFKKFVKDVVKGTVAIKEEFFTTEMVARLKERNARNMDYCLNTYELLFLGQLTYEYSRRTIRGKKKVAEVIKDEEQFAKNYPDFPQTKIVSKVSDSKVVIDWPMTTCGITVTNDVMFGRIRHWQKVGDDDPKDRASVVESIMECVAAKPNMFGRDDCSGLYEITMNTILNTENLLDAGKELCLPKWCKDLGRLKKRLKDGERLFGIEANQGGDGESCTAIYSLGGWDADALKYANVEVLACELG